MGFGQSKIEHEEAVTRCKDRKEFMKKAVSSRNAFAAAHSGYTISLKNTGAALSDYAQGEAIHHHHAIPPSSSPSSATASHHPASSSSASVSIPSSSAAAATTILQPPIDTHLPPPPPLPDFAPPPLQRAASMPDLPIPKKHPASKPPGDDAIREEDDDGDDADDEDEDEDDGGGSGSGAGDGRIEHRRRRNNNNSGGDVRPPAPPPPAPAPQQVRAETSGSEKATGGGGGGAPVWLSDYFFDTDNIPVPSLSQPEPEEIPLPTTTSVRDSDSVTGGGGRGDHDDNIREIPQEKVVTDPPLPPPPQQQQQPAPPKQVKKKVAPHHQHGASAGGELTKRGRTAAHTGPKVDLLQVMNELDDHFLKASESAHEVSKMLEATRMHYHSNFADNRGHIDHSARIMRVITWNRSCKNMKDEDAGNDDFDNEELETHATILDKMLAWEKKLYDEVKAGELMKIEYQRKVASLNKQKKRGASPETLEKTKAAVSHLHTRYIVDMQSMDLTVSEINRLRDKQLYPKLVDLVCGMEKMWEAMCVHHSSQLKIVADLRNLNTSLAPWDTSEQHHEITRQLWSVLREWHSQFQNLMKNQKEYIKALNHWLKLNLIPIESNLKEKVSSPPRVVRPAIQPLLHAWHDLLEKLPDDRAKGVISTFAEVVHTIYIIQEDELKLRESCEDIRREYMRKSRQFSDWYNKYLEKKAAAAAAAVAAAAEAEEDNAVVSDSVGRETTSQDDEIVAERKAVVDNLMIRLKAEEDTYHRTCKQVREKSIGSLKTHLPELFRALSDFALDCFEMYKKLRTITTEPQDTVEEAN